ncbi:GlxA family transcriptional regulator [Fodinicola acaciae]|uniref:GlxA family transcriptional regulator n=1 Tax=Fodinicola acaciae TaxID=2681555 RepID=UPI0013D8CF35|nr:helix-turn-helix domain-containing protein [Fodinicola acaciae]
MHRVAVLALDQVIPFELGIPSRIFGAATDATDRRLYEVVTCSLDGGPVATEAGYAIVPAADATALAEADTVVVAPFHCPEQLGTISDPLAKALAGIRPGTRIMSICTAAYVLAGAGLLDDRPATVHWLEAEHFQRTFPKVRLDPSALFVDDGDILTSAGAAAGVDLCLHVVRRDHGSEVANRVARACVVPPWRDGGQSQFIEHPVPAPSDAGTAPTRVWALENLHKPLPLSTLAGHARMSVRTFTRRFRDEVGLTPGQWLILQRVERGRVLLESSDLAVDQVAERAGFGAPSSFRLHFRAAVGVSPNAYRRTFLAT